MKKTSKNEQNLINALFFAGISGAYSLHPKFGWEDAEKKVVLIETMLKLNFKLAEVREAIKTADQQEFRFTDDDLLLGKWYTQTNVTVAMLLEQLSFFFED